MKHYQFKMRDEYGNESIGNVDAEDWQGAWKKLCILIRAGYKILVINDLDEPEEEFEEESAMSILSLVKQGDVPEGAEFATGKLYQMALMLVGDRQIDLLASEELADHIQDWFSDDEEDKPPVISLIIEGVKVSLDRAFVGAIFQQEYFMREEDGNEGEDDDELITEQGTDADGTL
jgi:hypothetical protein